LSSRIKREHKKQNKRGDILCPEVYFGLNVILGSTGCINTPNMNRDGPVPAPVSLQDINNPVSTIRETALIILELNFGNLHFEIVG